jgi:hypothetical protein
MILITQNIEDTYEAIFNHRILLARELYCDLTSSVKCCCGHDLRTNDGCMVGRKIRSPHPERSDRQSRIIGYCISTPGTKLT